MRACEPGTESRAAREGRERRERGPRAEGAAPLPAPTALPHRTREPSPQVCAASAGRARHTSASLLKSERPGPPPTPDTHTCTSTSGSWDSPPLHARPARDSRSHRTRLSPASGSLPSYPSPPCARQLTTPLHPKDMAETPPHPHRSRVRESSFPAHTRQSTAELRDAEGRATPTRCVTGTPTRRAASHSRTHTWHMPPPPRGMLIYTLLSQACQGKKLRPKEVTPPGPGLMTCKHS